MASSAPQRSSLATSSRIHLQSSRVTVDENLLTETYNAEKRKLSQKRKTLVSGDVLLEPQMSDPRSYLFPLCNPKTPPTWNMPHQIASPTRGFQFTEARATRLWGKNVHTCHTSSQTPQQRETQPVPIDTITCNSAFWSGPHFFIQPAMCQELCRSAKVLQGCDFLSL
uniref:Translin associated factor X interacting protein 1 n=1 Tax=Myotis myotis TaxID=51298 RepID=A0A7J7SDH5_MYOMY|nr:translin associated factor X interacting protein 1 [Myotis myotis]